MTYKGKLREKNNKLRMALAEDIIDNTFTEPTAATVDWAKNEPSEHASGDWNIPYKGKFHKKDDKLNMADDDYRD